MERATQTTSEADVHDVIADCMREAAERQLRQALETGNLGDVAELSRSLARAQAARREAVLADRESRLVRGPRA